MEQEDKAGDEDVEFRPVPSTGCGRWLGKAFPAEHLQFPGGASCSSSSPFLLLSTPDLSSFR